MNILIKPAPRFLTEVVIGGINVSLEQNAIISGFVTNPQKLRETFSLMMDTATYDMWGTDDEFVVNWTLEQLGFEKA